MIKTIPIINNSSFFGDVFDDPNEDPLLGGNECSAEETAERPAPEGQPFWMSEDDHSNGTTASSPSDSNDACQKQIVVDQRRDDADGIDDLNRAVSEG